MYRNISGMTEAQWNDAVTNAGRYVLTKVVFNGDTTLYGDGTDGAVVSIKFDEQMENSNGLSMGGTIASQCKVEIRQPSTPISLVNSTFVPYVGLKDSANREGYVPLGEFFATSADSNSNGGVVSVVGYDRFCKLEVPYEPTVSFPTTTTAIMADLATNRFTFTGTITDRPIDEFRVGTVKDWIGWLAGLEGKNARFNRDGQLEFAYYDITQYDYTVDRENQYMAGVNTKTADNVTINAITSGTEENPIVSGNGRSITFSNPYMTQEILDDIRNTEIVDSLTEVSGELITVDAIEAPAKSVEMNIEPYQSFNGYDSPWVGGAGTNLMPVPTVGLTINTNTGEVTGTPTETYGSAVADALIPVDFTQYTYTYGWTASAYEYNPNVMVFGYGADKAFIERLGGSGTNPCSIGSGNAWTDYTLIKYVRLRLYNTSNTFTQTETNNANWIMVQGTALPTAWTPYENICPIYPANGKNLLPYPYSSGSSLTSNGITFTVNTDGSVSIKGTATGNADLYFVGANGVYEDAHIKSGDYRVTLGRKGGMPMGTYVRLYVVPYGGTVEYATEASLEEVTIDATATYRILIRVSSGATVDATFYPMISSVAYGYASYAPYKGFSVTRTGKNVLPPSLINATVGGVSYSLNADGSVTASGTSTSGSSGKGYLVSGYRPPNGTYTLSGGNADVGVRINSYTKDGTLIDRNTSYETPSQIVINDSVGYIYCGVGYVSANKTVNTTIYPQLELGTTATAYEPYQGEVFCNVGDQAYYGGTLDMATGVLTVTHSYRVMDGVSTSPVGKFSSKSASTDRLEFMTSNITTISSYGFVSGETYYVSDELLDKYGYWCSVAPCRREGLPTDTYVSSLYRSSSTNGTQIRMRFPMSSGIDTLAKANQWLADLNTAGTPFTVVTRLRTPQTYQLTPTQVELLKGTNHIWADNSTLNITYLATPRANMSFRPMELQWRGNPCVQCGDRIFVETETNSLTALVMAHSLSVEGGMNDVIKCFGSSDAEVALDKSPMEKKISTVYNALQSAIQDATALLNGTRGGIFEITKENDINTGWLIKESASPNYMGNVIVANYNGIGFSTDGGATYGTAITTDGHINGQYITAHSVDVEALSVGNTSDPFSNYVYIGRRRPNDDNTDMVIRIGVASQSMVQEMRGNRTSIYKAEDVQAYVNGSLTDAQLDARALMYYSDTDYVLLNLGSFRIGGMLMQAQANGGVKFIKAE